MSQMRTPADVGPVMVGVDGSQGSLDAVDLATWEARQRRVPLVLVHGFSDPVPSGAYGWMPRGSLPTGVRDAARSMLTAVEQRTQADHPDLSVRSMLVAGGAASTLVELSRIAGVMLVGTRGAGGFAGLLIGSVSAQVAAHAHAPVIVVRPVDERVPAEGRGRVPAPGRVVVGIDGSSQAAEAVRFAVAEASARQVPLTALYAWWEPPSGALGGDDAQRAQAEAELLLAEGLEGGPGAATDVTIECRAVRTHVPATALIEASADAGLLVVGSRGRGGFASLLLGSVSRSVLAHAGCPVAVIRAHG